ncbi:CDPK-related kinase 5-like [Prunus yedoensis var. nudiflora]|uniref:CDPK-related kinase 5-like n=1 Tax=Prunus yedoensis var. nudiflora TaxID=2094558 RepID=A0A314Y2K3_PRUYE|nr:CDPK-related kinase 5-like [Prunus yedoensis var. nudiflora]
MRLLKPPIHKPSSFPCAPSDTLLAEKAITYLKRHLHNLNSLSSCFTPEAASYLPLKSQLEWLALMKNATDAMKESRISDLIALLNALQYRRMDFEEFCAAALSVHQLEALHLCEQHARCVYELFERDGNRAIVIEELASELGFGPSIPLHVVLHDWIRHTDGNVDLLHGVSSQMFVKAL